MPQAAAVPDGTEAAEKSETGWKLGQLEDVVGVHLRLANAAVYRAFMAALAFADLTQRQLSVLWLIEEEPGIAQIDLAGRLDIDRATMMAIIDRLESRNLLTRERLKADRRRQALHLTAHGMDVFRRARDAQRDHETWLKSLIGDETAVRIFVETLRRIYR